MITAKRVIVTLIVFTVLFYVNVNLTKITKTKIIEYYNDIMKDRQSDEITESFINTKLAWRQNGNSFSGEEDVEYVSVTSPERTRPKPLKLKTITPTNTPREAVTSENEAVTSENKAVTSGNEAVPSRNEAVTSRNEVVTSRNETVTFRNEAVASRNEVETSRNEVVTSRNNVEVVFPSLTNCSMEDYKRKLRSKHYRARAHLYVCRKWQEPNLRNTLWPMMVPPTNGSLLKTLPIHHQDSEVERLLYEQAAVQAKRVARLTDTCLNHPELATRWQFKIVWDTSRTPPLVYCPIYKVASTTWSVYFLRLAHVKTSTSNKKKLVDAHTQMSEAYPSPKTNEEKNALFPKSLRFVTVRHPFTRLLSAYRDKINTVKPKPFQPYFLDLQRAILRKYRAPNSNNSEPTPTFPEFVQYLIDWTENFTTARDWSEHVVCWTPYWVQCAVCSSDFQVVIKLETMDRDVQFLAEVAQLKEIQNVQEWRNQNHHLASSDVLPEYFGQLTKNQIELLYQRYKLDFDLFGYSIEEYLTYART